MKRTIALLLTLTLVLLTLPTMGLASDVLPSPAGELPVVPEGTEITLTVGVMQTPFIADYENNYLTKWIEEKTGVKLEFVVLPMDTMLEKMLLTLSTSDTNSLPDIYLARAMAGPDTIFMPSYASRWYDEGMIIPLNDLIDNYGYYTQQAFDVAKEYGYTIKEWMTSADGNIYSLPGFSASLTNSYPHKLWINQGWLDKLGLEMPTTTEEFYNVLTAFKTQDPNGNGQADEIPFSGAKQNLYYGYDFIINAFIYNHSPYSRMYVEDGTVKFAPTTDQWREAMKYLRKLHDEGLYYEGSFTQDTTSIQQMAINENDILGSFEGLGHDLVVVTKDQAIIDRYNSMPALIGPEGNHFVTWNAPTPAANGVITAKCKYPEIAFRVLDMFMSDEAAKIARYGEKGVNWDDADEGTQGYYGTPAIMKILENTWAAAGQNQNFFQQSPFILDPAVATGIQWGGDPKEAGYIKAQSVVKLDQTGVKPEEVLSNLVFTLEEIDKINTPKTDIDQYILQTIANFVAGDWDPSDDAQWASYVAEYEKMGLPVFLETVQTAYTRMMGAK
jgi:putative aldouronate transport system substrate-binding protein